MTAMLLRDPDAVFIHIPKNAGTSIRSLWDGKISQRAFGTIPQEWMHLPKFAVVRAPEARFLSAVRMFKFGNPSFGGFYGEAVWPELTIDMALDAVEDEKIAFERSQRYIKGNFRHHVIAQTHPYNTLYLADHILRQENLADDWAKLAQTLELPKTLERKRTTQEGPKLPALTAAQRTRIQTIFAQDYKQLGYDLSGKIIAPPKVKKPQSETIWQLWPFFFSDQKAQAAQTSGVLPCDDVDLTVFAQDVIAGRKRTTWAGRDENFNAHFHGLLPEFVGKHRLAHLVACCIVVIRKTKGAGPGLVLFHRILDEQIHEILPEMNSRWLTSIADTLADHGQTQAQRALGLCGSVLSATVKLTETERHVFEVPRPWPPNARFESGGSLYDGTIAYWTEKGDMVDNLLERISNSQHLDVVGGALVQEIMARMFRFNTIYARMDEIHKTPHPPDITDEIRARFRRLTRKWL